MDGGQDQLAITYRPIGDLIPYARNAAPTARRRWR